MVKNGLYAHMQGAPLLTVTITPLQAVKTHGECGRFLGVFTVIMAGRIADIL